MPARLIAGPRSRLVAVEARDDAARLVRLIDEDGLPVGLPAEGLTLPESLAEELGVAAGDTLLVKLLVPPREVVSVQVAAVIRQSLGQTAYMSQAALFALLRQVPQVNKVNLLVDDARLPALYAALKQTPGVSALTLMSEVRRQFDATMSENLMRMVLVYSTLGVLITVGVVYNAARIQLAERAHELASLRVLGFTRAEVSYVLVGELMVLTLAAVPFGWIGGTAFAALATSGFSTDMIHIPFVVSRRTYGLASMIVVLSALASALIVRRRLDGINIAMALKQRG